MSLKGELPGVVPELLELSPGVVPEAGSGFDALLEEDSLLDEEEELAGFLASPELPASCKPFCLADVEVPAVELDVSPASVFGGTLCSPGYGKRLAAGPCAGNTPGAEIWGTGLGGVEGCGAEVCGVASSRLSPG